MTRAVPKPEKAGWREHDREFGTLTNTDRRTLKPRAREVRITEHAARSFAGDERTWRLGPDALVWREGSRQGQVRYGDVTEMRLVSFGFINGLQYQCSLRTHDGTRFRIRSHHYRGLWNFEDRSASYGPFIRELARRIARHAPGTKFVAGSTARWFAWLVIGILLVTLLMSGDAIGGKSWWASLLVAVVAPIVIHRNWQGRAILFDPRDPPRTLLGGEG